MKEKIKILSYTCNKCNFHKDFLSNEQTNTKCKICGNELTFCGSRDYNPKNGLKAIKSSNEKNYCTDFFNQSKPIIACPYCRSTNTNKIGVIGRSVSFGLFGFGSSKVGKQWHCNNCKSDF